MDGPLSACLSPMERHKEAESGQHALQAFLWSHSPQPPPPTQPFSSRPCGAQLTGDASCYEAVEAQLIYKEIVPHLEGRRGEHLETVTSTTRPAEVALNNSGGRCSTADHVLCEGYFYWMLSEDRESSACQPVMSRASPHPRWPCSLHRRRCAGQSLICSPPTGPPFSDIAVLLSSRNSCGSHVPAAKPGLSRCVVRTPDRQSDALSVTVAPLSLHVSAANRTGNGPVLNCAARIRASPHRLDSQSTEGQRHKHIINPPPPGWQDSSACLHSPNQQ
ncbi:hypothetical protein Q8A73_022671 [Channa argus]|nr:hypothetical protein Q8A73_022671 [Channa argus]